MSALIRRATAAEVVPLRHSVLRPGLGRGAAIFAGDDAPTTLHWVAVSHAAIVGVVSVFQVTAPVDDLRDARYQLRGMATAPAVRGSGVGATLLHTLHAELDQPLWCNARTEAVGFYARLGWVVAGETFDIPGVGAHQRMSWRPTREDGVDPV